MNHNKKWIFCDNNLQRALVKDGEYVPNAEYKISLKIFIIILSALVTSFLKTLYYYFLQFFVNCCNDIEGKNIVFLKSGNGYDYDNLYRVFHYNESEVLVIDSFTMTEYMKVNRVGIFNILSTFFSSVKSLYASITYCTFSYTCLR